MPARRLPKSARRFADTDSGVRNRHYHLTLFVHCPAFPPSPAHVTDAAANGSEVALCPACVLAAGFCVRCVKAVSPRLAQPFWYRLVGTHHRDAERDARQALSPEGQKIARRKQTREARRARSHMARAASLESLLRSREDAALLRELMDRSPEERAA